MNDAVFKHSLRERDTKRHEWLTSSSASWLPSVKAQRSSMSHSQEMKKQQQDANYKTPQTQHVQRHISRAVSDLVPTTGRLSPSSYYAQNDNGMKQSVPTYVLKDISGIAEEPSANLDLCASSAVKRSLSPIQSSNCSTNCDRNVASTTRRQKSATRLTARPAQQQLSPRSNKTTVDLLNSTAARNKSMECNVLRGDEKSTRRTIRPPSHTSSATRCSTSPASRSPVTSPRNNHQLQRKVHTGNISETVSPFKRTQTYSVKKPLPSKPASSGTLRGHSARQKCSAKSLAECSHISPSCETLYTQITDSQWHADDIDDDKLHADMPPGVLNNTRNKPKSLGLQRLPTPKPSVRQLKNVRTGLTLHAADIDDDSHLQQVSAQLSNAHSSKGRKEQVQTDGLAVRSHVSPSEHSITSRCDTRYYTNEQQQMFDDLVPATADCASRHVQIAKRSTDDSDTRNQRSLQQETSPTSSASQESIVISCRPHHSKTRRATQLPPTVSASTLATDAGRLATKPVPVAPSGPAGHRRVSKIPRPKLAIRPSISVTSTISKCSSVSSLRSEFNYARPMPIERIPFSKFGLECIVPLARQEVSVTAVDAFSIMGVSGQRKRFLPLIESIAAEDLWERVQHNMDPLLVVSAKYDAGDHVCQVSIMSSVVARSVSHAATQTRRSVSLSTSTHQKKKTGVSRKEKAEKQNENNEDYSGMLVRLVQLLYLQTKLNASKTDKNNSASSKVPSRSAANSTLMDYLQKHQHHNAAPTATANISTNSQSSDHGARVYRMGSSVTQVYSKNYPSMPVGNADVESANTWGNTTKSRTLYFDQAQQETKPWSNHRGTTPAAFKPTYNQRHNSNDNRSRITTHSGSNNMRYSYY